MKRREFIKIAGLTLVSSLFSLENLLSFSEKRKQRLVMVIDISRCAKDPKCKICVDACHEIHNVPQISNPKEQIMWIWKSPFEKIFERDLNSYSKEIVGSIFVPCMCNHCENPPCTKVCPTGATWKRDDGIVMMDYHRCIGCRYCMAACPYGSRSFNWRDNRIHLRKINYDFPLRTKGVVEKCNFCEERLFRGLQPRCVEACPSGALAFGNILDSNSFVSRVISQRFSLVRKPHLGTDPNVFYVL